MRDRQQRSRSQRQNWNEPGVSPLIEAEIDGVEKEDEGEAEHADHSQPLVMHVDVQEAEAALSKHQADAEEDDWHRDGGPFHRAGDKPGEHQHRGDEGKGNQELVHRSLSFVCLRLGNSPARVKAMVGRGSFASCGEAPFTRPEQRQWPCST